jgi:hypothetical protein
MYDEHHMCENMSNCMAVGKYFCVTMVPGFSRRIAASFRAGPRVPFPEFCFKMKNKTQHTMEEGDNMTQLSLHA